MPWFSTAYYADSHPVNAKRLADPDDNKYIVGKYGNYIWARNAPDARRIAKKRKLGEGVLGVSRGPRYQRASTVLRKKGFHRDVLHNVTFVCHMALKSGAATPEQITGDQGVIHEYIHGEAGRRKVIVALMEQIEARIPGYLGKGFK